MKYIITHKSLSSTEYAPERECITVDAFKKMTLDFCHGATIHGKTHKHPTPAWRYDFVDNMPQIYIRMSMTTTEQAYDFGQKLIEACYKANRVKYEALQQAYKDVFRILQRHQCWFPKDAQLPNPSTRTEVWYEDAAAKDVRNLNFYQTSAEMSDEELRFYCRAFNINAPEWFITFENHPVKYTQTYTENGVTKEVQKKMYAICPTVTDDKGNKVILTPRKVEYAISLTVKYGDFNKGDPKLIRPQDLDKVIAILKDRQAKRLYTNDLGPDATPEQRAHLESVRDAYARHYFYRAILSYLG